MSNIARMNGIAHITTLSMKQSPAHACGRPEQQTHHNTYLSYCLFNCINEPWHEHIRRQPSNKFRCPLAECRLAISRDIPIPHCFRLYFMEWLFVAVAFLFKQQLVADTQPADDDDECCGLPLHKSLKHQKAHE